MTAWHGKPEKKRRGKEEGRRKKKGRTRGRKKEGQEEAKRKDKRKKIVGKERRKKREWLKGNKRVPSEGTSEPENRYEWKERFGGMELTR